MKRIALRPAVALLLLIALAWATRAVAPAHAGAAAAPPSVIRIEPAAQQVAPGGIITASIVISEVANLYGADVRLTFNPAVLAVVDADTGASGIQLVPGPLLTSQGSGMIFINQAVNATGSITYVSFLLNPALPFTGTGVLAYARFQALAPGASALSFTFAELSTNAGQNLPRVTEAGSIVVAGLVARSWLPAVVR